MSANGKTDNLTLRQDMCIAYLIDPRSETFDNVKQSGIRAGYAEDYADQLAANRPEWLLGSLRRVKMLSKAEKNLDEFLDKDKNKDDKIRADITKFTVERLGKDHYSRKKEVEHSGGVEFKNMNEFLNSLE